MIPVRVYLGRFTEERHLFDLSDDMFDVVIPERGNFIFKDETAYKVLYTMLDADHGEYCVFVRESIEEDF